MSTTHEGLRQQAILRLAFSRKQNPELAQANDSARIDLAAAIIAMDDTEDFIPGHHNLQEQMNVNLALQVYCQSLADLIRGEATTVTN